MNHLDEDMKCFLEIIVSHHAVILTKQLSKRKITPSHRYCFSSEYYCHHY